MAVIEIKNPKDGSVGETTEEAFDAVWKEKGWTKVERSDLTPKQRLIAQAEAAGLDTSGTKDELEERLRAAGQEV